MDDDVEDYGNCDEVECAGCYQMYKPIDNDGICPICGSDEVVGDR